MIKQEPKEPRQSQSDEEELLFINIILNKLHKLKIKIEDTEESLESCLSVGKNG